MEATQDPIQLHLHNMKLRGYAIHTRREGSELLMTKDGGQGDQLEVVFQEDGTAQVSLHPKAGKSETLQVENNRVVTFMNGFMQKGDGISLKEMELAAGPTRVQSPHRLAQEDIHQEGSGERPIFPKETYEAIREASQHYIWVTPSPSKEEQRISIKLSQIGHLTPHAKHNRFLEITSCREGTFKAAYFDHADPSPNKTRCDDLPKEVIPDLIRIFARDFRPVDPDAIATEWRKAKRAEKVIPITSARLQTGEPHEHAPKEQPEGFPESVTDAIRSDQELRDLRDLSQEAYAGRNAKKEFQGAPHIHICRLGNKHDGNSHNRFLKLWNTAAYGIVAEYFDHDERANPGRITIGNLPEEGAAQLVREFARSRDPITPEQMQQFAGARESRDPRRIEMPSP